jgi:hypothetical protein
MKEPNATITSILIAASVLAFSAMSAAESKVAAPVQESPPSPAAAGSNAEAGAAGAVATRPGNGGIFFQGSWPETGARNKLTLGLKIYVEKSGVIKSFYFYQGSGEAGPHVFHLWSSDGKSLLTVNALESQDSDWIEVPLPTPFPVAANTGYIISYASNATYVGTPDVFVEPIKRDGIVAVAGVYTHDASGRTAPGRMDDNKMNYFIDVLYEPSK